MNNCPNCGASVEEAASYCVACGGRLPLKCLNCGVANQPDSRFCRACGFRLGAAEPHSAPRLAFVCPRCQASNETGATYCYSCGFPLDEAGPASRAVAAAGTPAGFWIRLLAWLIDGVVLAVAHLLTIIVLPGTSIELYYTDPSSWTLTDSIMALVTAAYDTFGVSIYSTTLGKRALGLYVLRRDGSRVSTLRAFGRHLAGILSGLLLFVGYLMIAVSADKRGLHDHICDTVVVKR